MKKQNSFFSVKEDELKKLIDMLFNCTLTKVALRTEGRLECEVKWDWEINGEVTTITDTVVFTKYGFETTFDEAVKDDSDELYEKFLVAKGLSRYQENNPFMNP